MAILAMPEHRRDARATGSILRLYFRAQVGVSAFLSVGSTWVACAFRMITYPLPSDIGVRKAHAEIR